MTQAKSIRPALVAADDALAREIESSMRSDSQRVGDAHARVSAGLRSTPDTASQALRHGAQTALDTLAERRNSHIEGLKTSHLIEDERLKSQAKMLDSRIDDMQHTLSSLIEQRGEVEQAIRDGNKAHKEALDAATKHYSILIESQRKVIATIDGLNDGA